MVETPIWIQIDTIIATEATFTASKKVLKVTELRNFLTKGFNKATKTKEGKKIAKVDTAAPEKPLIWYPINVTDEKTGPGVN